MDSPESQPVSEIQPRHPRQQLAELLGDLPPVRGPVASMPVAIERRENYILETSVLDLNGSEPVPAYFARPHGPGPFPCILYNHQHGGNYHVGKTELVVGSPSMQRPAYAEDLARHGIASMCIDHWCFGERSGKGESETFKQFLWHGRVMWGMMVFDSLRSVDYLTQRQDIDPNRIGTLGMSMGSTMAWWMAALDQRIKACVDICCLTDFQSLIETRHLDGHGLYYFVPGLLKYFTTAQINALIAPRAHLSVAGDHDKLTPPAGLARIDAELRQVYAQLGAPDAWELARYPCGHQETAAMRARILAFLRRWL